MNPDLIARLRTESLAATLTAARSRRLRRRTGAAAFAVFVAAVVAFSIFPRHHPPSVAIAVTKPAAAPVPLPDAHIIRTALAPVARISPRETSLVRFSTDPASRVERIDNAGLASCFPDKGIAVIQPEGELAQVVFF
jgi:hypothetical protein